MTTNNGANAPPQTICPSDLALDRLTMGELSQDQTKEITAHAESCTRCEARLSERRAGFSAFPDVDERRMLAAIRSGLAKAEDEGPIPSFQGLWRKVILMVTPLCAVAAVAALVVLRRTDPPEADTTRIKGGLALRVFRFDGQTSKEAISGETFGKGERLRFVVDLPTDGEIGIVGVEDKGSLYVAWPTEEKHGTWYKKGNAQELPGAVALDESEGREHLYLVLCDKGPPRCSPTGPGNPPKCGEGCRMTSFVLQKGGPKK